MRKLGFIGRLPWRWALCFALLTYANSAAAWCQMRTGEDESEEGRCEVEGELMAWPSYCLSYSLNDADSESMTLDEIRPIVARSFDNWRGISCGDDDFPLSIREDAPRMCAMESHDTSGPNVHTIAFTSEWPENYDQNAYAITVVWFNPRSGAILDADMLINERRGPYGVCPLRGCQPDANGVTTVDLENVITHEIGHFFGLAHSQFNFATMHAFSPAGETDKRSVSSDDVEGICTIYPPMASPVCEPDPRNGLGEECRAQGGCQATLGTDLGGLGLFWVLVGWGWVRRHRTRD